ncbi:DNA gyrase subunit A [Mycoplasma phocimorsus]|uniref:DNA gyrase subunit A n=1 Tax=Mycoplasma phocimorsus TaxID=3045839 RepID=A0AAJ1PRA6_9MOLU|nr:DNA gyrase subunit A [Mycoplasma phocimorsus]MDJ1645889.1 DNA gyrase subunit A [Mycoplasma phocimorsus]MDJ1646630.1 DNA gyrase subunit A [Mycoplasma phocimorsus]MDJ1647583.1 DNA gyrase subunit A [Mycoplasma phocimorsus]MDJ1648073.1 DNA gyrase subunit A [Mycoplasma phocimorsus]MDJ1648954.1 DNA gyrase subunit A [Mycoplasma phocimorsus]
MLFFDEDKEKEQLKVEQEDFEDDYESVNTIFNEEEVIEEDEDEYIPQNKEGYIVESKIIDAPTGGLYPQEIRKEMKDSFLEYAMSVIVSRALPDVRDGLKPVHRRILFGMNELGITHSSAHKKSARIVGDVLGKYHPHGDSSVYEAMVRLAQDFSLRYPLIDGHGNFGSIDGDPAAAMRYTEARMSKIASEMLDGINKNTVDFIANYDASEQEPVVLPSRFPNILIMGATGIAVGMATSIPPHNLKETIDAVKALALNPQITITQLMEHIKGPDFPIGAEILGTKGIIDTYLTGKGTISVRSKAKIETGISGKSKIIISEIPYELKKITIIEKIAELVKYKAIEGISDLRDESNKDGIRIVISIKKNFDPAIILNQLYRQTPLQTNYNANMVALVNGEPKLLNLKQMLEVYLQHQFEVVTRRLKFDLEKAQYRLLILEGLKIAVDNIDEVIKIIKSSSNDANAIERLKQSFNLVEVQAKAIVDMRLGRLTGLAIEKMNEEIALLMAEISKIEAILASRELLTQLIIDELEEIKNKYGDERRTIINENASISISDEDLVKQREIVISISSNGYVKRTDLSEYRLQKRGGVGTQGMKIYEGNDLSQLIVTSSHIDLLLFTSLGRIYRMRALQIPDQGRQSKGLPFINLLDLQENENVISMIATDSYEDNEYLITITKKGIIKKTSIKNFIRINANGKKAMGLKEDDELVRAMIVKEDESIIIASSSGHVVKFNISQIRDMSRSAIGVIAIKLENDAYVISASHSLEGELILSMSTLGFAKLTNKEQYRETKRGARGVLAMNIKKAGTLIGCSFVNKNDELFLVNNKNITLRTHISQLPDVSRNAKGVKAIKLKGNEFLKSYSIINTAQIEE